VVGASVAFLTEGQNLNFAVPTSDIRALLNSPIGHIPFPAAEKEDGTVARAEPNSEPGNASSRGPDASTQNEDLPRNVQREQQFEFRLQTCAAFSGVRVECQLAVRNRDRNPRASQTLYLLEASFSTAEGALTPIYMQLGDQHAENVAGLIDDARILSGSEQQLLLIFTDLPSIATRGDLLVRSKVGLDGESAVLEFSDILIRR